jgi:hypothetical protein
MAFGRDRIRQTFLFGTTVLKTFSGQAPAQEEQEIKALIDLFLAEGVYSYGEIGARWGDSFYWVLTGLPAGAKGVALDLPGAAWGRKETRPQLESTVATLKSQGYNASVIFGDSATPATIQLFRNRGPYDAILIDGDHRYEGVLADWTNYRSMSRLVAFHDIVGIGQVTKYGDRVQVPKLWKEIKAEGYKTVEFVAPGSRMGIGVVYQ